MHTFETAKKIADANNASEEDGWVYEVTPVGSYFAVTVKDETGETVGAL